MAMRLACNLFSQKNPPQDLVLSVSRVLRSSDVNIPDRTYRSIVSSLMVESLLNSDAQIRSVGASLAYNIGLFCYFQESSDQDASVHEEWLCELFAACSEAAMQNSECDVKLCYAIGFLLKNGGDSVAAMAQALQVDEHCEFFSNKSRNCRTR